MIFGMWNPEKSLYQYLIDLPTSTVCCSHFTLGNPKCHFSTLFIYASHYLRYLRLKRTVSMIVNLPITPEKCHRTTRYLMKCRTHSSDGRYNVQCLFQTLVAVKRRVVLCSTCGCEKSRLWCVATWMSGRQRHSKCSKCPPSSWRHASSLFCHAEIQPTSQQAAAATRAYRGLVLCIHAPASCPRCSNQPGLGDNRWRATYHDWWNGQHRHDCHVLVHCVGLRQTRPQQCCLSLAAALASATRLNVTVQVTVSKQLWLNCIVTCAVHLILI